MDYKHSDQKAIVGMFAAACLKPFVVILGAKCETPPFRPGKVLLEDTEGAKHPQVKMFLAMMGCTDVSTIDPDLEKVCNDCKNKVGNSCLKNFFGDNGDVSMPTFNAGSKGLICSHCEKSDMNIKQCICKKAYFCNKECQTANWSAHKKDHKRIMQKLAKKKSTGGTD